MTPGPKSLGTQHPPIPDGRRCGGGLVRTAIALVDLVHARCGFSVYRRFRSGDLTVELVGFILNSQFRASWPCLGSKRKEKPVVPFLYDRLDYADLRV